ncbi:hypothetical protein GOBAR_AA19804 [Gossypium barbadense]|uniref:Uncharacterized protein n=1 Tax=Gossypium barbadense TaxID=3634 RepID=A0A2P5XC11_GOSBA|nr:hypothetical protein GOBAR_AA19804 [Gossypium barbadense]
MQGLETQIGQLAKLISERPQSSLPNNTESNLREQLNVITTQDEEGLVELEPELRQGTVETRSKNTPEPCSSNKKGPIYEERRLQVEELDECCHGRATWPWASLSKQHGRATRLCLEIVVETENLARACDTPVPTTVLKTDKTTRACAYTHGCGRSKRIIKSSKAHYYLGTATPLEKVLHDCHVLPDHHDNLFIGHCGCGTEPLPPPEYPPPPSSLP